MGNMAGSAIRRQLPTRKRISPPSQTNATENISTSRGGKTSVTKQNQLDTASSSVTGKEDSEDENHDTEEGESKSNHNGDSELENNKIFSDDNANQPKRRTRRSLPVVVGPRKTRKLLAESDVTMQSDSLDQDGDDLKLDAGNENEDQDDKNDEDGNVSDHHSVTISERDNPDDDAESCNFDEPLYAIIPSKSKEDITVRIEVDNLTSSAGKRRSRSSSISRSKSSSAKPVPEGRVLPARKTRVPPDMLDTSPLSFIAHAAVNKQKRNGVRVSSTPQHHGKSEPSPVNRSNCRGRARGGKAESTENDAHVEKAVVPETRRSRRRSGPADISGFIGDDGNLFFCHFCNEVGEVVCCDGCPKVYHPTCIPKGPSRESLDNDDDPWYCPTCYKCKNQPDIKKTKITEKTTKTKTPETPVKAKVPTSKKELPQEKKTMSPSLRRTRERRVKQKCSECQKSGGKLVKCKHCPVTLHYPSCAAPMEASVKNEDELSTNEDIETSSITCTNCRAEHVVENEEEERSAAVDHKSQDIKEQTPPKEEQKMKKRNKVKKDNENDPPATNDDDHKLVEDNGNELSSVDKKRKVRATKDTEDVSLPDQREKKRRKKKTKLAHVKKKKKETNGKVAKEQGLSDSSLNFDTKKDSTIPSTIMAPKVTRSPSSSSKSSKRPVKMTPAFFFFLADIRPKLEKTLSRKDSNFRNLPKSVERNLIIAKEGALWWRKISNWERKTWEYRAAKDFEDRVIEWKENTLVQQMRADADELREDSDEDSESDSDTSTMDGMKTKGPTTLYSKAYMRKATTVPSVPKNTTSSPHISNTTVFGLLQDVRFHPVSMVHPNRTTQDFDFPDFSKMTIPYFEVHGPISTHIGDECHGCTRGWCHFCPILKRHLPALEHRSKLQPPLSSLSATRVGLGSDLEGKASSLSNNLSKTKNSETLYLDQPSNRVDDVVQFVEESIAMKLPPNDPFGSRVMKSKDIDANGMKNACGQNMFECGGCGETIYSDLGCSSCRTSLLIKEISSRRRIDNGTISSTEGLLKMQTMMLSRAPLKECNFEKQREGDKRVGRAILNMNWKPDVILPYKRPKSFPAYKSPIDRKQKNKENNPTKDIDREKTSESANDFSVDSSNVKPNEEIKRPRVTILDRSSSSPGKQKTEKALIHRPSRDFSRPGRRHLQVHQKECPDVQELAEAHKYEADNLQKKCLSFAIAGVLLGLMRRDPLRLFAEPVPASVENYHKLVLFPMDFRTIRQKTLNGDYTSFGAFISDVKLLCNNAIAFNLPGSIYSDTAKEISSLLEVMQKRATKWISVIKNTHAASFSKLRWGVFGGVIDDQRTDSKDDQKVAGNESHSDLDPYYELRKNWPDSVYLLENGSILLSQIRADFLRTKENEGAYYGALALRRVATAAAVSLSPVEDLSSLYKSCISRSPEEDEDLRRKIDTEVSKLIDPVRLLDEPGLKEKNIIQLLRSVQSRRVEGRVASESGCARCDGASIKEEARLVMKAERMRASKQKKNSGDARQDKSIGNISNKSRIAKSRLGLSTGLGSQVSLANMKRDVVNTIVITPDDQNNAGKLKSVSVGGSKIHGWGLFADHSFKKGEVVAEYVGEYIRNPVADKREKMYQERRIQDYQFRVADNLVIDATLKGGYARYINHNCSPNCIAKIIDGNPPNKHLKRVMIISQRNILAGEEITYDYQFPLELDLDARIPCNCGSDECRSFMNWDLPEKDSSRKSSLASSISNEKKGRK